MKLKNKLTIRIDTNAQPNPLRCYCKDKGNNVL